MLSITSVLSLFVLLAIATAVFFAAKRFKIPYTVLLVLAGILLVPIVKLPYLESVFGFLDDMKLTPELLFYIFLPVLIFESAFNMNIRRMLDSAWTIASLAVVGMFVSALLIATLLYFVLPLIGLSIPFIIALLFGAIISATDPVAVLALFKEYGAPKRLRMIFEGESLFNDGTAVAMFMVILAIAASGFQGAETLFQGAAVFMGMVVFGVLLGLLMATLFSRALRAVRSNEFVTVTLLIISAHLVFILGELINENGLFGLNLYVSSIIATTVAALFLGNYSRQALSSQVDEYLGKFIEHMAFIANSLVFLLAGLLFASSGIDIRAMWLPILVTVMIVATVRVIAVYAVTTPLNIFKPEATIPRSWQMLLSWGSLRGALAIIIVLLIPPDFTVQGWQHAFSPREFLLAITIGCILATLFIKAPLIGPIMRKLKVNQPDPLKLAQESDLGIYYLLTEQSRFSMHRTRGFVRDEHYRQLIGQVEQRLEAAVTERDELVKKYGIRVFERSLHLAAIRVESRALNQLYVNGELDESVLRKLKGKLSLQKEKIEYSPDDQIDPTAYTDRKDIFDRLVHVMQTAFARKKQTTGEQRVQYYRTQMIMARKAVKTLKSMQGEYKQPVFLDAPFDKVINRYEQFKVQAEEKLDNVLANSNEDLSVYLGYLARKSLAASGGRALAFLHNNGITDESLEDVIVDKWSKDK